MTVRRRSIMSFAGSPRLDRTRETRNRLDKCWEVDINWGLYPAPLRTAIRQVGKARSVPPAAVLGGLLILVSFLLSPATVTVPGTDWAEPVLVWLTISMPTGSRKSTLYQFLRDVLTKVRQRVNCTDTDPSWLVEDATFDKMGVLMAENNGRLMGMYDELSSFLSKIRLYSKGALSDSHELPMFLELYNASPWTRTTITGEANFAMDRTWLTVGGFTQPTVARSIIDLTGNAEKGLSQRFLWLFPKPVYGTFSTLEPVDVEFTDKLVNALVGIWNKAPPGEQPALRQFSIPFDQQTDGTLVVSQSFVSKYDMVQEQLGATAAVDDLLSGMLSKSTGQILRVSAAFHVLLSLDSLDGPAPTISQAAVEAAIDFVEVCCQHTAFITGRGRISEDLELIRAGSTTHAAMASAPKRVLEISTEALLLTHPGKVLDLTKINKAKKFRNRGDIHGGLAAMQTLEKAGLGKLAPNKSRGSMKTWKFEKMMIPEDADGKADMATKLGNYSVSLVDYARAMVEESTDEPESKTRPRSPVATRNSPRKGRPSSRRSRSPTASPHKQ